MPHEQIFSYIMHAKNNLYFNDDISFVPNQRVGFLLIASSLKQQSTGRHIALLRDIIVISRPASLCSYSLMLRA